VGHVFAELELSNPRRPDFVPVQVSALVDTGALMLCIPKHVARQLDLERNRCASYRSRTAGRRPYCTLPGPLKVAFGKRFCYVSALVIGDKAPRHQAC